MWAASVDVCSFGFERNWLCHEDSVAWNGHSRNILRVTVKTEKESVFKSVEGADCNGQFRFDVIHQAYTEHGWPFIDNEACRELREV